MYFIAYILIINLFTFATYTGDKRAAQLGQWRVSESNLHFLALMGGSPAALFSCYFLRHKVRKDGFMDFLYIIIGLQIIIFALSINGILPLSEILKPYLELKI